VLRVKVEIFCDANRSKDGRGVSVNVAMRAVVVVWSLAIVLAVLSSSHTASTPEVLEFKCVWQPSAYANGTSDPGLCSAASTEVTAFRVRTFELLSMSYCNLHAYVSVG
jgi:hypothetical protein